MRARIIAAAIAAAVVAVAGAPAPAHAATECKRAYGHAADGTRVVATVDAWGSTPCTVARQVARTAARAHYPDSLTARVRGHLVVLDAELLVDDDRDFQIVYSGLDGRRTVDVLIRGRAIR